MPAGEQDGDGDAVPPCAGDCDDADGDTYPGAPELCDGIDNDCDLSVDEDADGVNSGTCAGRVCWAVSGTFCGTRAQGTEASKILSCFSCGFFTRVLQEEGLGNFKLLKPGQVYEQT